MNDAQVEKDSGLCKKKIEDSEEAEKVINAAREYRKIQRDIRPYSRALAQVFEQVMRAIEERISVTWAEGFTNGRFNVERFIRKYSPELATERPELIPWNSLDVYDQKELTSRFLLVPNQIRVRLVLDGSGSMNEDRILALQKLTVLILEGLTAFEETMNLRFRLNEPFKVDTEIRMFGTDSKIVKSFAEGKPSFEDEQVDRFKAFSQINNSWNLTSDAKPLKEIAASIESKLERQLKEGKAMEFVFEITDGGSDTADESKDMVRRLIEKKVIAKAFQIGNPSDREKEIFNGIWEGRGKEIPNPADLAPAMAELLATEIEKMKFIIRSEDESEIGDEED